jgi:hypothetical protein
VNPTAHQKAWSKDPVAARITARTAVPKEPPTCWAIRVRMLAEAPVSDQVIEEIVDQIALPVMLAVRGRAAPGPE